MRENKNSYQGSCFRAKPNIIPWLWDIAFVIYNTSPQTEVKSDLMIF
jgi:hypothetical protein